MVRISQFRLPLVALAALFIGLGTPAAQPLPVGQAKLIVRDVWGTVEASRRRLIVDADVFWQELIETGTDSAAKMVFLDGATLSTGPDSRVRIDEFVYAGGSVPNRIVIDIGRGIMRFVSGVAPLSVYRVRTPSAMIGVRGTDFTVAITADGSTRVFVRRGEIQLSAAASGAAVVLGAGEASAVEPGGTLPPDPPAPPDADLLATATEMTTMLAVEADGDPATAAAAADVTALGASKGLAAGARGSTVASQTGADCSGC